MYCILYTLYPSGCIDCHIPIVHPITLCSCFFAHTFAHNTCVHDIIELTRNICVAKLINCVKYAVFIYCKLLILTIVIYGSSRLYVHLKGGPNQKEVE
jgi:hypothetical protein